MQTSNFAAEYGQVGGGYFNYTMKSGTNALHGTGYDYFVNEALNAGLPFTNAGSTNSEKDNQHIRNPQRRNDYRVYAGWPHPHPEALRRKEQNPSSFSTSMSNISEIQNIQSGINTVPTLTYRDGNFSNAGCFLFSGGSCLKEPWQSDDWRGSRDRHGRPKKPAVWRGFRPQHHPNCKWCCRSVRPSQATLFRCPRFDSVAVAIQNLDSDAERHQSVNNFIVPNYSSTYQHVTNFSWKLDHSDQLYHQALLVSVLNPDGQPRFQRFRP